jgi:myo-inositol-1(or 4)-monophosphatase
VTDSPELKDALVTNYLMRPAERFAPLAGQQRFLAALGASAEDGRQRGRIGVGYGSISLCHVATGQTDAMVEFAKGFATWDLYPGHYILEAAGGVVLDLQGDPIPLEGRLGSKERIAKAMSLRQEFVATATVELANEIISTLDLKRG